MAEQERRLSVDLRRKMRRGSTLLFFLGGMVPMIMLSMMLAVDLTRIVDASRQAGYVAENSAIAATLQYSGNSTRINQSAGAQAARSTAELAIGNGTLRHTRETRYEGVRFGRRSGVDTATVTISYEMDQLLIAQFFIGRNNDRYSVTRTAEVCIPDASSSRAATLGFCSRPRASGS